MADYGNAPSIGAFMRYAETRRNEDRREAAYRACLTYIANGVYCISYCISQLVKDQKYLAEPFSKPKKPAEKEATAADEDAILRMLKNSGIKFAGGDGV